MKTRILALIAVLALGVCAAAALSGPGWMRHSSISPDGRTIVFTHKGGLVAHLARFFSGKQFFRHTADTRSNGFEPKIRWTGPSVSLANEANCSDGHRYADLYKMLKLGPLAGMPVPGTCTFAGWEMLQVGLRWGVPGVGVKDLATGRYLENQQTEPDIKLTNEYHIVITGKHQQLEAAVAELMKLIKEGTAGRWRPPGSGAWPPRHFG